MRVDPALVFAAALLFGASAAVQPVPALLAALCVAMLLARRLSLFALGLAVFAFAAGAARARLELARFESRRVAVRDALAHPSRCAGRAAIVSSPVWAHEKLGYIADFDRLECEGRVLRGPLRVRLYGGPSRLARGDRVGVVAQLAAVRLFREIDLPDPTPHAARQGSLLSGMALSVTVLRRSHGLRALIDLARAHVRRRIQATFAPAAAAMARALVIGENDLTERDNLAFRRSGLAHLLAVSGTHLVLAVVTLVEGLSLLLVRLERLAARWDVGRFAAAIGGPLALVYADFAGGGGSAWRAAWMLAAGFGVRALGRQPRASRIVSAALLVGALVDPLAVFDISFLLSGAATCGLLLIGVPLMRRLTGLRPRALRYLASCAVATIAAMLPCAPLLALLSPTLSLAGVAANVLAAPLGELVALPLCLVHTVLGFWPSLEHGVALVASGALLVVKRIARAGAGATWFMLPAPLPDAWQFALLAVGITGALLTRASRRVWWLATLSGLVILELALRHAGHPRGELRVSVLDVGQGDSAFVDLPDGRAMLIDGGGFVGSPVDPGRSVLLPLLRARRRRRLDVVVLTHPHPDHFTGLASALPQLQVGEFWDTGQGEAEGAGATYARLLRGLRRRHVRILRPAELCGRVFRFGAASVTPLEPCPGYIPHEGANNNSIVFTIRFGQRRVLFTGDAEAPEEARLLARHADAVRADLLKVGHHGSRTSTTLALLRAVRPRLATISCGVRNRFGHPHPVTLEKLARAGIIALRTDRVGAVTWQTDGRTVSVHTFSAPH